MRANNIAICMFTWVRTDGGPGSIDPNNLQAWPAPEAGILRSLANAVAQFEFDGQNVPIEYANYCSLSDAAYAVQNQDAAASNGINPQRLPALAMWAQYPDGRRAGYTIIPTAAELTTSTPIQPEAIHERIKALWEGKAPTKSGWLCQLAPKLCDVPAWLWLIAAGYTSFESITSEGRRQLVYGGVSAVLWVEFFQRGGFKFLKEKL